MFMRFKISLTFIYTNDTVLIDTPQLKQILEGDMTL